MAIRACCSARIYGWRFAPGVPLRAIWGNWINGFATVMAYYRYFSAVARGLPLVWLKTEHAYPNRAALIEHKRKLGEVLVGYQYIGSDDLESALAAKPAGIRLGDYLIAQGKLSETDVYEALSLQQNVPFGKPEREVISRPVTRSLPAEVAKRWKVLPYKVAAGHLFVAGLGAAVGRRCTTIYGNSRRSKSVSIWSLPPNSTSWRTSICRSKHAALRYTRTSSNPMKTIARILMCFSLLFSAVPAADSPALQGFSPDSATSERAWESKFKAIPAPAGLREYMQRLSARPHHVGSPYDKDNAEWILAKFKEWGLDAQIENV